MLIDTLRWSRSLVTVGLVAALVSACSLPAAGGTTTAVPARQFDVENLTFAVVTHGGVGDEFWDRVESGAMQAAADHGVTVQWSSDPDPGGQSLLIQQAIAAHVDGIVVSLANPDGLSSAVFQAVSAGIPVVSINSGLEVWRDLGIITHVGQSESMAGAAAGAELVALGGTNGICVIHEVGNIGQQERCAAAAAEFGGAMVNVQVDGASPAAVASTISAQLQTDPSIDAVLALQSSVGVQAAAAAAAVSSDAIIATFDLSTNVLQEIINGSIAFAVDQQPYVQGYLAVTALYLRAINGNVVGGGEAIYSGPAIVNQSNAEAILRYAEQGTR
ncbi:MAG: substrate-binding domain-containing protein [Promicromonosporaceae bacterium]|nr:substrate-binding domain-containing protein [Promicromonosporaceae bacterium]